MTTFEPLVKELQLRSGTYVMVRAGITLRLSFPEPIQTLGPSIAAILERYLEFIKPETLQTYLASNAAWKPLSSKVIARDLKALRSVPAHYEFVEYHYGHGAPANVGAFGAHVVGWNLADEAFPLRESLLLLEFPEDILQRKSVDSFVAFVASSAASHPFGSGCAGYSFRHLHLSFRDQAFAAIAAMAPRYLGFDINSDSAASYSRGRVYNVSWLTLLGTEIVAKLGGGEQLREKLSEAIKISELPTGLLLRAADLPIVGDVNRGAEDVGPLAMLARVTRPARMAAPNIGPNGDFAPRWFGRFDNR